MRALIQRVINASVKIDGEIYASINNGLLLFIGIEDSDIMEDIEWLSRKISGLRIFRDKNGNMNLSVNEVNGEILVISQFTLFACIKKGNRPSFIRAAKPEIAIPVYNEFVKRLEKDTGEKIKSGEFGTDMKISLINDGPVTITIDTRNRE